MRNKRLGILLLTAGVAVAQMPAMTPLSVSAEPSVTGIAQEAEDAGLSVSKTVKGEEKTTDSEPQQDNTVAGEAKQAENLETVHIKNTEEFAQFAKSCHVDSWSRNKLVLLDADLVLTSEDSETIATFGGRFDGQGHKISGLRITGDHGSVGLFCTLQNGGIVENLQVTGTVTPNGIQSRVGGIVGVNYGTIKNCSYEGTITADNELGAIAGRNMLQGQIIECTADGTISGSAYCGGITGYNEGTVNGCRNMAEVNTTYKDSPVTVDQLSNTLENIQMTGQLNSAENIEAKTDTGGIAGYSSGNLLSCSNMGTVGYEHVGYNVGGIAGRSSGFINGCDNTGTVYGRKDVGGIAGQLQPYLTVSFTQSTLNQLDDQMNELNRLVNQGIDNADLYANDTLNHLTNINGLSKIASDSTKALADEGSDRYDEAAKKANTATATIQNSLRSLSDVMGQLSGYLDRISGSVADLDGNLESYMDGLQLSEDDKAIMRSQWSSAKDGFDVATKGVNDLADALQKGPEVSDENKDKVYNALKTVRTGYSNMKTAVDEMLDIAKEYEGAEDSELVKRLSDVQSILKDMNDAIDSDDKLYAAINKVDNKEASEEDALQGVTTGDLSEALADIGKVQGQIAEKIPATSELFGQMLQNYDIKEDSDPYKQLMKLYNDYADANSQISKASQSLGSVIGDTWTDKTQMDQYLPQLQTPAQSLQDGLKKQNAALQKMIPILEKEVDNAGNVGGIVSAMRDAQNAMRSYPNVTSKLTGALNDIAGLDLKLNGVSDTMRNNGNNLYSSVDQLTGEMQALQDALRSESDAGADNLRAITNQFNAILKTMQNGIDDAQDAINGEDRDTVQDVSDESLSGLSDADVMTTTMGRTTASKNMGRVQADTNVGGITGMIGVEYDLDPEKDIVAVGDNSLDYIFKAQCIVDADTNSGRVVSRNNYAGGIAGHMEMGLIANCESYGTVEGGSDYAGGIAGYSVATVRNNAVKADVGGSKYVGGVAGYGVKLRDNLAMVGISEAKQYKGAIAGRVKNIAAADVSGNYFYSENVYGIDDVSYDGIAEGVTYEYLSADLPVPSSFGNLILTFVVDEETIGTRECAYGGSLTEDELPEIPAREGFYAQWSRDDFTDIREDAVIEAVYTRITTVLTGADRRVGGLSIVEVDGQFKEGDTLHARRLPTDEGSAADTERWEIQIPGDGAAEHRVRFLPPAEMKHPKLYMETTDASGKVKSKAIQTEEIGKYLTFTATGDDVTFRVEDEQISRRWYIAGGVGAGIVLLFGLYIARLKRIRRKKSHKHQPQGTAAGKKPQKTKGKGKHKKAAHKAADSYPQNGAHRGAQKEQARKQEQLNPEEDLEEIPLEELVEETEK